MAMAAVQAAQAHRPAAPAAAAAAAVKAATPAVVPNFTQHLPGPALPALSKTKNRDLYRERSSEEREEVTWYEDEEHKVLAEPRMERLLSQVSRTPCIIVFTNKTPFQVRPLWMDFNGAEVAYTAIAPNETKRFRTYESHPWIVREVTTAARMMLSGAMAVVGAKKEQEVVITPPPLLQWEMGRHSCYPEDFKAATKAFLLAHKKAEKEGIHLPAPAPYASSPSPAYTPHGSPAGACYSEAEELRMLQQSVPAIISINASPGATVTATVTVSPRKAAPHHKLAADMPYGHNLAPMPGQSTVNIQLTTSADSPMVSATVCVGGNSSSHMSAEDHMDVVRSHHASGCPSPRFHSLGSPKRSLRGEHSKNMLGSLLSSFKSLISGTTCSDISADLRRDQGAAPRQRSNVAAGSQAADAWPSSAPGPCASFGALPSHLLVHIVELAVPVMYQHISCPLLGRPDVSPALLACSPEESARQAQADAAAQAAANANAAANQQPAA